MTELRRRLLDDLHRGVLRMANSPWYDLHRQLAAIIYLADGIRPASPGRDDKGRFIKSGGEG